MVVGNIRETFGIYSDSIGTEFGTIQIGDTGILIKTETEGGSAVPFDYIKSIKAEGEITLGKVKATMVFFDVMGERHELTFMVSDMKLALLRDACGK